MHSTIPFQPGAALEPCGPGLLTVREAMGSPAVLQLGFSVDTSPILTVLTEMTTYSGLGDEIADLPAVGSAPEWMSERSLAQGAHFVASGASALFGVGSPVGASEAIADLPSSGG